MAMNLRLTPEAAEALRAEADRQGRSQQDLLREAVDRFLGRGTEVNELDRALAAKLVKPPSLFREVQPSLRLADGVSSLDLLDRDSDR